MEAQYKRDLRGPEHYGIEKIRSSPVELITPQKAEEWLAHHTQNRPISLRHVQRLAEMMLRGEWMVNGEPIILKSGGGVLDGQHRLEAVKKSGVSIHSVVIRNIDSAAWVTIDQGLKRTVGHLLASLGERDYSTLAGATVWVARWKAGTLRSTQTVSSTMQLAALETYPQLRHSIPYGRRASAYMPPSLATFCHFRMASFSPEKASEFFEALISGAELSATNPVKLLRDRLLAQQQSRRKLPKWDVYALVVRAWNAWSASRPLSRLQLHTTDQSLPDFNAPDE